MRSVYLLTQEERTRACKYCSANLKRIRKILGLRQEELAFAVGTTQRHISEIENGKAKVSWTLMLAISTILAPYPQIWQIDDMVAPHRVYPGKADGADELERLMIGLKPVLSEGEKFSDY